MMYHMMLFVESIWRSTGNIHLTNVIKEIFLIKDIAKVARRVNAEINDHTKIRELALSVLSTESVSVTTNNVNPQAHKA